MRPPTLKHAQNNRSFLRIQSPLCKHVGFCLPTSAVECECWGDVGGGGFFWEQHRCPTIRQTPFQPHPQNTLCTYTHTHTHTLSCHWPRWKQKIPGRKKKRETHRSNLRSRIDSVRESKCFVINCGTHAGPKRGGRGFLFIFIYLFFWCVKAAQQARA